MAFRRNRQTNKDAPRHNDDPDAAPVGSDKEIVHRRIYGNTKADPLTAGNPSLPIYGGGTGGQTPSHPFFGRRMRARFGFLPANVARDAEEVERR